jgi:alpha-galactosidase
MIHGHNLFRRMMLKHYVPNHDVGTDGSPIPISLCDVGEMVFKREWKAPTEENQLSLIKRGAELGFDAYWLDAYWFAGGDWIPSAESFPRGLQPIANAAHGAGMKFILWFEPEWIRSDSQLTKEHPEFIYGGANGGPLKLGDRKAREFMIDFLDKRIKEYGVDIFRHDYNNPAIGYWHAEGGEDRQGVTEMLYIEGLYTLWSDLLKRNPGLIIDNCAGGGRRIDIESCSLTHQFYKSDWNDYREQSKGSDYWPRTSVAEQVMLNGLALYVPYRAGVLWDMRPYIFRSAMASGFVYLGCLEGDDLFRKQSHEAIAELKALRPLFLGDYYPLLELTSRQEDWCAYQFDRPDLKEGCVFVFRRPDSRILMCELSLYNIDVSATYEVSLTGETYRQGPWNKMRGSDLASREIRINDKPGSVLLRYRRLDVGK